MAASSALSLKDLADAARRRLPSRIHGYVSGGSEDHASLDANRATFRRWRFRTRPLVDVSQHSLSVDVFGTRYEAPVGIAPMGVSSLCCFDGDVALARAAAGARMPSINSSRTQ